MGAGHDHGPGVAEAGQPGDYRRKLWIAFGITATIVVAQAVGSVVTGSLALLTDTAHAITDASGLLVALIAATLMLRPATSTRTWGFRRIEVIAALGQATLLLVVGFYTAIEGIRRLFEPPEVPATELLVFGIVGLAANITAILILSSSRGANFNMRAAFLEVLNDALGSLGVIVAAIGPTDVNQIVHQSGGNRMWTRFWNGTSWSAWSEILQLGGQQKRHLRRMQSAGFLVAHRGSTQPG